MGDREPLKASDVMDVTDLRRSLIKSLTTVSEDRRDLVSWLARDSLDMRRSWIVSLCSRVVGVHPGAALWWSTIRGDCLSSRWLNSERSFGGSNDLAAFGSRTILAVTEIDSGRPRGVLPGECEAEFPSLGASNIDSLLATEAERSRRGRRVVSGDSSLEPDLEGGVRTAGRENELVLSASDGDLDASLPFLTEKKVEDGRSRLTPRGGATSLPEVADSFSKALMR